jgi:hypothetical protein
MRGKKPRIFLYTGGWVKLKPQADKERIHISICINLGCCLHEKEAAFRQVFLGAFEMTEEKVKTEAFQVNGDEIIIKIKELLHEGNIRRIIIKNEADRTLIDIPLTLGVVGALLAPQLAAIGAIAALIAKGTIVIEKVES